MYKLLATKEYKKNIQEFSKKCKFSYEVFAVFVLVQVKNFIKTNILIQSFSNNYVKLLNPDYNIEDYKCYKIRIKDLCSKKGKSGSLRLILAINLKKKEIIFLIIYEKSKKENILETEIKKILNGRLEEYNPCIEPINEILSNFNEQFN
jgi:mRNA-degrading endonuclease RelE of RelBE toxin-antitoxin system